MARQAAPVTIGPGRDHTDPLACPMGAILLGQPPQGQAPTTKTERPERLECVSVGRFFFADPLWGPVSFDFSIWRRPDLDMPSYEVVIE